METKREAMILKNLPLVTFMVGRMSEESGGTIDREDALAYGVEGLIQAVDSYDETRGTTFASFAIRRIRGSILDASRRQDILPRSLRKSTREVERANLEMAHTLGRWPTPRELAERMEMPVDQVRSISGHSGARVFSLEKMMGDGVSEGSTPWEAADPDEIVDPAAVADRRATREVLMQSIHTLAPRDQKIIKLRYMQNMPFHQIGNVMGLSESRVCQLHKRILNNLKHHMRQELALAA